MKSLSRRTPSFGSLLRYMARERAGERPERTAVLLHNLRTEVPDLTRIEGEFVDNARHLPIRRNGVALYHEILSLGREDAEKITPAILQDLARHYLNLRAPRSLAYGEMHWRTGTPHVHLMISGNEIESGKKTRLSKGELARVKRELERYQRERFPLLERSRVEHGRRGRRTQAEDHDHGAGDVLRPPSHAEQERERRLRRQGRAEPSRKEVLAELVTRLIVASSSEEVLLRALADHDLRPYRRGQTLGILDPATGRRLRLLTLVLERYADASRAWQRQEERTRELERLELGRIRRLVQEIGVQEEVRMVLHPAAPRGREKDLRQALDQARRLSRDPIAHGQSDDACPDL